MNQKHPRVSLAIPVCDEEAVVPELLRGDGCSGQPSGWPTGDRFANDGNSFLNRSLACGIHLRRVGDCALCPILQLRIVHKVLGGIAAVLGVIVPHRLGDPRSSVRHTSA